MRVHGRDRGGYGQLKRKMEARCHANTPSVSTKNAGWVRVSREQPGPAVQTRHRAPVQQGSRAAACLLGLPGERSHRPSTAAGAAAEGLARSHRRPPLHVRMPGLMAICLYGMTLTAHTRRLCLPRATPRPTRGGLHRRVCIFTAISQGPPTYHAWICSASRPCPPECFLYP